MTDEVVTTLENLTKQGDIASFTLSTHDRKLACEAIEGHRPHRTASPWNPIMVRYSAAHRGAEERVLPLAKEKGVSVITFNNTCYGRLLHTADGGSASQMPRGAADCYRFALAHPAVHVSLTAPANMTELEENLAALTDPTLSAEQMGAMRQHGDNVYAQDRRFESLVRQR